MAKSENKLKSLTFQEKIGIIETLENGKSIRQLSQETGISKNTLHFIFKNREKIKNEVLKSVSNYNFYSTC